MEVGYRVTIIIAIDFLFTKFLNTIKHIHDEIDEEINRRNQSPSMEARSSTTDGTF